MEKKYEFTGDTQKACGCTLRQIRALRSFGSVTAGDLGGWIEKEENLSHEGACWVGDSAQVRGLARVRHPEDLCVFQGFGREYRSTTAHIDAVIGIRINCGCFSGSLDEFRKQVIETHGAESRDGLLYLGMANMIEVRLEEAASKGRDDAKRS